MRWSRLDDAAAFLTATDAYRGREPYRTNVMASIAETVAEGSRSYDECFWWVLQQGAEVVGAAFRTVPYPLSLGPMQPEAAVLLGDAVARADDGFATVAGPAGPVDAFLGAYSASGSPGSAREVVQSRHDVLQVLGALSAPAVGGSARAATNDEVELAADWYAAFAAEVDREAHPRGASDLETVATMVRLGRLRLWWDRDEVVAMAGNASPVTSAGRVVTRVGPVYTPPERRGRGYAAALTADLAARLRSEGADVMLFADQANPTSNGVYHRLGFTDLDVFVRRFLGPR